tara:strand:+ start:14818 stop:15975 length:1158 start_codon:yes stop_codon:yes gene_type:complete
MYGLGKKFNLNDLSPVLNVTKEIREYSVKRIIFDSRLAQKGDLFIPLKGLNYDGEDFCKDAIDNGAAVLTTKIINGPAIKVNDVYKSLLEICNYKLLSLKPKIIFITGSYGKTTIKDMLKTILGPSCHASKENENNEFGIPFTILSMPKDCEYLVVECGARKPNDFDLISNYLFCDVFILTSIAENHLTTFGTVENIVNTKMKLKNCLKDKSNFIDGRSVNKESILEINKEILKKTLGLLSIDMELDSISFKNPTGRGNIIDKHNGQIIDQTYNAHPDTVLATANEENPNETILILGDMAELGDKEYEIHFDLIKKLNKYEIFLTGAIYNGLIDKFESNRVEFFQNEKDFPIEYLSKQLKAGKKIYFKGSRSSKMERYLKILLDD